MAVVLGTSAGFVTVAPTSNPSGSIHNIDALARVTKDTCPAENTVTEIGFYAQNNHNTSNFEVGIYSHNSGSNTANVRLFRDNVNTTSGSSGWQVVTGLDWLLTEGVIYWIGVQVDSVAGDVKLSFNNIGGRSGVILGATSLPSTFSSMSDGVEIQGLYAKVEIAVSFKELSGSITASSGATASLSVATQLAGSASASSGATASLSVATQLASSASASSGATASLSVATQLAGSASASSGVTASLSLLRVLSGLVSAISGASADLSVAVLVGSASASSSATASLSIATQLAGSASVSSSSAAPLSLLSVLSGLASGVSNAAAALSVALRTLGPYERTASQITTAFQVFADANSYIVRYDNDPRDTPDGLPWLEVSVEFDSTVSREFGQRRANLNVYRSTGALRVTITDDIGKGIYQVLAIADIIETQFSNTTLAVPSAPGTPGIIFRTADVVKRGRTSDNISNNRSGRQINSNQAANSGGGNKYQVDVTIPFQYDFTQ